MGNIMKKWKGILAVILITGCLGGCSQFQAEHNAVKVKRDGSVQAAVIDTLDKSYYSEDELKQTIDDSVSAYNQSQEGDPIVVKKFNVTDGKAELYMNYAASRDYQDFNNVTFYAGDLQGAYNQKYEFPDEFQKVANGKVTGSVTRSDILSGLNYNVVICSEEMDIEVPGKILTLRRMQLSPEKRRQPAFQKSGKRQQNPRRRQHRKVRAQTAEQNPMAMRRKASLK